MAGITAGRVCRVATALALFALVACARHEPSPAQNPSAAAEPAHDTAPAESSPEAAPVEPAHTPVIVVNEPAPVPDAAPGTPDDPVVATVGDERIYEREVVAGMPRDIPDEQLMELHGQKVQRLIATAALGKFFAARGIVVGEDEIDRRIAELREHPPAAQCTCCTNATLEEFMQRNAFAMDELRRAVRNEISFQKHTDREWARLHPADGTGAAIEAAERTRLEGEYFKVSHIFFAAPESVDPDEEADAAAKAAAGKAAAARARIAAGESFEDVARAVSEDGDTATSGGALGCVGRDALGPQFAEAVGALAPGVCSEPFVSPWGYHIARRETPTDDDLLGILKRAFVANVDQEITEAMWEGVAVKRFDEPGAGGPGDEIVPIGEGAEPENVPDVANP